MNNQQLGNIIGRSRHRVKRIFDSLELDPESKEGELALLLSRVYRCLYALNGGDQGLLFFG